MSLLDSIVANMGNGGAKVLSRNDNLNSINWVAGMSDPGEMIGCGQYQELRREANETDRAYQARLNVLLRELPAEHRDRIVAYGVKAAQQRLGIVATNGRINALFARKGGWHDLGTVFDREMTGAEVLANGFDWTAEKVPFRYEDGRESDTTFYIRRSDTKAVLSEGAGSGYKPAQNWQAIEFLDKVIGRFGAKYEAALELHGGAKIVFQVHLPRQSFKLNGKDENKAYATWVNPHIQGECIVVFATSKRTECENTTRQAVRKDGAKGIRIRHTGNLNAKIEAAQDAMGITVERLEEFHHTAEQMVRTPLNVNTYTEGLLDAILDVSEAECRMGAEAMVEKKLLDAVITVTDPERELMYRAAQRKINHREKVKEDLFERYDSGRCEPVGTAWAAYNMATEGVDHGLLGGRFKGDGKESRKFESVVYGEGDDIKQVALQMATGKYQAN